MGDFKEELRANVVGPGADVAILQLFSRDNVVLPLNTGKSQKEREVVVFLTSPNERLANKA